MQSSEESSSKLSSLDCIFWMLLNPKGFSQQQMWPSFTGFTVCQHCWMIATLRTLTSSSSLPHSPFALNPGPDMRTEGVVLWTDQTFGVQVGRDSVWHRHGDEDARRRGEVKRGERGNPPATPTPKEVNPDLLYIHICIFTWSTRIICMCILPGATPGEPWCICRCVWENYHICTYMVIIMIISYRGFTVGLMVIFWWRWNFSILCVEGGGYCMYISFFSFWAS